MTVQLRFRRISPRIFFWRRLRGFVTFATVKALHPTLKTILLLFIAVVVYYAVSFFTIEHRRTRLEPWLVTFSTDATGSFTLQINQARLGITNVMVRFPDARPATNFLPVTVPFQRPRGVPFDLPFGECVFMDTTFQPGTVVIRFAGHEIQMLPRVLTIDHRELPWRSGDLFNLSPKTAATTPMSADPRTSQPSHAIQP